LIDHAEELARTFAAALPEPVENVFASASYRRRMIAVILARQLLKIAKGHP
jgi:CO/xanthine dehydrogenase FAD-binding subunit